MPAPPAHRQPVGLAARRRARGARRRGRAADSPPSPRARTGSRPPTSRCTSRPRPVDRARSRRTAGCCVRAARRWSSRSTLRRRRPAARSGLATMSFAVLPRRAENLTVDQADRVSRVTMGTAELRSRRPPFHERVQLTVVDAGAGAIELPLSDYVGNSMGAIQGGMVAAAADAAAEHALRRRVRRAGRDRRPPDHVPRPREGRDRSAPAPRCSTRDAALRDRARRDRRHRRRRSADDGGARRRGARRDRVRRLRRPGAPSTGSPRSRCTRSTIPARPSDTHVVGEVVDLDHLRGPGGNVRAGALLTMADTVGGMCAGLAVLPGWVVSTNLMLRTAPAAHRGPARARRDASCGPAGRRSSPQVEIRDAGDAGRAHRRRRPHLGGARAGRRPARTSPARCSSMPPGERPDPILPAARVLRGPVRTRDGGRARRSPTGCATRGASCTAARPRCSSDAAGTHAIGERRDHRRRRAALPAARPHRPRSRARRRSSANAPTVTSCGSRWWTRAPTTA